MEKKIEIPNFIWVLLAHDIGIYYEAKQLGLTFLVEFTYYFLLTVSLPVAIYIYSTRFISIEINVWASSTFIVIKPYRLDYRCSSVSNDIKHGFHLPFSR